MKTKGLLILVMVLMLTFSLFASAAVDLTAYQLAGTSNLALDKTATASSSYEMVNEGWTINNVNDGKVAFSGTNGWSSSPHDTDVEEDTPAWVKIDLGEVFTIKRVVLFARQDLAEVAGFPVDFEIQVSNDGENWTKVIEKKNQNDVGKDAQIYDLGTPANGRYVRLYCTKRTVDDRGDMLVQLDEIAVYGNTKEEIPPTGDSLSITFALLSVLLVSIFLKKKSAINI